MSEKPPAPVTEKMIQERIAHIGVLHAELVRVNEELFATNRNSDAVLERQRARVQEMIRVFNDHIKRQLARLEECEKALRKEPLKVEHALTLSALREYLYYTDLPVFENLVTAMVSEGVNMLHALKKGEGSLH